MHLGTGQVIIAVSTLQATFVAHCVSITIADMNLDFEFIET